jgi:hypothetical protein
MSLSKSVLSHGSVAMALIAAGSLVAGFVAGTVLTLLSEPAPPPLRPWIDNPKPVADV